MKKCVLTIAAGLFVTAAVAQDALTFAVDLTTGVESFTLRGNPWGAGVPLAGEVVNGRFYRHVHFESIPDAAERAALSAQGVHVLYFESGTTYVASIEQGTVFPLANAKLKGISFISARSKMLSDLYLALNTSTFPLFAVDANGRIGITFTYYPDLPHQTVTERIAALQYEITYANANSHRITVWMNAAAIEPFCAQPFVCMAELIDDVPQPDNNVGRTNHRDNWMAQEFPGGRNYNGAGVSVMLQDDGVIGPHIDYTGRIQAQYISYNGGDHGDHCAGIIMGGGNKDPLTRGMGWGANLYVYGAAPYTGWDSIYTHYYTNSIVITSTSYSDGCNAGYTTLSQELDQQTWDMPNLIHVFSAGNNGGVDCQYGAGTAFGNITGGHKHSKNTIAVGNLNYLDNLASSSSVGPVHDGRMKPEVCAVGTNVYSTIDANSYAYKTGTSMACPAVSGTFSEMYQAYSEIYGATPKSGLMKAVLMNTCDDLENAGPDFRTGYGRINGRKAVTAIENGSFLTDSVDNAQTHTHNITVPAGTGELKVMVYWHDYPAAPNANVALVNNLDINVTTPALAIINPWVLDYTPTVAALSAPAVRGTDIRNNHEQVTIQNPSAGNYTITVHGTNVPMGPQTYFVTWYFEPADELVLIYPNGGEGFAPGETQTVRWDAQNDTAHVSLRYTVDGGVTWGVIASNLDADDLAYNWNVPAGLSGLCRVRIFSTTAADTSDADFTIAAIPPNLHVRWACPDSLCLEWGSVAGATSYDVFTLGAMYMDSIVNTTADSVIITGLNNYTNTYWYSVRTRCATTSAVGRRAIAIEKAPGIFCPGTVDAAATQIISPLQSYFGCMTVTGVPVTVKISNPGYSSISNVPVSYSYDNGTPVNEVYTGTIASGASVTYTFTATLNIGATGNHQLRIWTTLPSDIVVTNDTTSLPITYTTGATFTPPYAEDFETFTTCPTISNCGATNCPMFNGWFNVPNNAGDDIDWRTNKGATPTINTGPAMDLVPGTITGNYLYLEASNCENATAMLVSPCFDLTTFQNPRLLFGYHMLGSGMGSLRVDIYSNGQWINDYYVRSGSQNQNWLQANVNLASFMGQTIIVRFRGITGTAGYSDMAIDYVRIDDPTATPEYSAANMLHVYPNPAQGQFNFSVEGLNNEVVSATVYDISGRVVFAQNYGGQYGTFQSVIDLSAFENGSYFLRVLVGEAGSVQRLVKGE